MLVVEELFIVLPAKVAGATVTTFLNVLLLNSFPAKGILGAAGYIKTLLKVDEEEGESVYSLESL